MQLVRFGRWSHHHTQFPRHLCSSLQDVQHWTVCSHRQVVLILNTHSADNSVKLNKISATCSNYNRIWCDPLQAIIVSRVRYKFANVCMYCKPSCCRCTVLFSRLCMTNIKDKVTHNLLHLRRGEVTRWNTQAAATHMELIVIHCETLQLNCTLYCTL